MAHKQRSVSEAKPTNSKSIHRVELNDVLANPALMGAASALGAALANFQNELDKAKRKEAR